LEQTKKDIIITVTKQFGESTAVWFAATRSFVLLEKPAFEVFDQYIHDIPVASIVDYFIATYNAAIEDSKRFVNDIIEGINQLNNPENAVYEPQKVRVEFDNYSYPIYAEKYYLIGNTTICFRYGNEWLMDCFHPTMAHLESDSTSSDHLLEVVALNDLYIFRYNGISQEAFSVENGHYLRGAVSQKLFGIVYDIEDRDWMVTLHSAAISDGKSVLIFPAEAGSGKSTLTAILQAHDYTVLSDDFNAINRINKSAYRLPLSISVKEGSLKTLKPFYPQLGDIVPEKAVTGKVVRYLPVANNDPKSKVAFPVKAFVFVKYSKDGPFIFEEVERKEAMQSLLPETWVNPDPENVKQFFNWFDEIVFYRLQYSDYHDALVSISMLFNK